MKKTMRMRGSSLNGRVEIRGIFLLLMRIRELLQVLLLGIIMGLGLTTHRQDEE